MEGAQDNEARDPGWQKQQNTAPRARMMHPAVHVYCCVKLSEGVGGSVIVYTTKARLPPPAEDHKTQKRANLGEFIVQNL